MKPPARLMAWAELLRVSALFTVPGDAVAGAASIGVRPNRGTALAVGASLCLYEAGMALNDWADRAEDAVDRPQRPIPSGRVTPGAALAASGALTVAGLALAAGAGRRSLAVATALAATIWAYDLHLKHTPAAPAAMAAARSLDLLLGATATRAGVGAAERFFPHPAPPRLSHMRLRRVRGEAPGPPDALRACPQSPDGLDFPAPDVCAKHPLPAKPGLPAEPGFAAEPPLVARPGLPAGSLLPAGPDSPGSVSPFRVRQLSACPAFEDRGLGRSPSRGGAAHVTVGKGRVGEMLRRTRPAPARAAADDSGLRDALAAAAMLGAHTYAVTAVSRRETQGGSTAAPLAALAAAAVLTTLVARKRPGGVGAEPATWWSRTSTLAAGTHPGRTDTPAPAIHVATRLATHLATPATLAATAYFRTAAKPLLHAALNPSPPLTQRAVGGGIRAMIPLQAALAARGGAVGAGAALMGLVPIARKLSRKVSPT